MRSELEAAAQRFAVFAGQVLEPAVYTDAAALDVSVFQCAEPVAYAEAVRSRTTPVPIGWRWGPVWSTAWFRLRGRVPAAWRGRRVALRFSSGAEALLWQDAQPRQAFDYHHDAVVLFDSAAGNEEVELHVEAACNRPLGATLFWWEDPDLRRRWSEPDPGQLTRCELTTYAPAVWRLWRTYEFARQLLLLLPTDAERARRLCDGLRSATEMIDERDVVGSAPAAQTLLETALRGQPAARTRCLAVGHAHIDTAWLWRLRETQRKCQRTFATALALMDEYPEFRFLCSQAQQYAWIEEQSPALFARIAARVRDGRWEAGGAMWVEPDANVPSGESLVRQILHGTRYWQRVFGPRGAQRFLYLPDTFGFSAALPQIMALAGLDTFITNKLSWNDTNEFPHTNFRWRGLDGTEVLAHCTPGRDYNATLSPLELQRGEKETARKDGAALEVCRPSAAGEPAEARQEPRPPLAECRPPVAGGELRPAGVDVWLQPFGYGDGGGGPTAGMLENARLAAQCEGLPQVTSATAGEFCAQLHAARHALQQAGRDLPVWDGELYLEYHRGTYTTQAWLKRANRRAEQGLRTAEWLAYAGPAPLEAQRAGEIARQLDEAWKLVLLNQFHDILPGSSITEVYADARVQHECVRKIYTALIQDGVQRWAEQVQPTGLRAPMLIFNPASTARRGVVECAGRPHYVADVPALGVAVRERAETAPVEPVVVREHTLSNGLLAATIDDAGRVTSLRHLAMGRETCRWGRGGAVEPMNQLVLYEDRPRAWDAWDIDLDYEQKAAPVDTPAAEWRVVESGPLRAVIEVARPLGQASRITQRFVLEAGAPRLDIYTQVDWHESHRLLRARFPVDVRASEATYEIAFGHLARAAHRNSAWDRARFEVSAHRWMDLSERGCGVALLNDCKYGHSCHDGVIGLSLLRSPKFPDPQADMGLHEFTYSLMPHAGDWRAAGVDREAEALNAPLLAMAVPAPAHGAPARDWAPFTIETAGAAGIAVAAVKRAEDDARLIVRLVETHGGRGSVTLAWNLPAGTVEPVDLLERSTTLDGFAHDAARRRTTVAVRPFQIVTLAASRTAREKTT